MNNSSPVTLIVGCDGRVGSAMMNSLKKAGRAVIGTTKRPTKVDESHPYLDLSQDLSDWQSPRPVSVAIVCAGVTSVDECRREPELTGKVNILGVSTLVESLVAQGVFVIYLSSIAVFDGTMPHPKADDPTSPVTEYGRQRVETESRVGRMDESVAIVRFSRILAPEEPLFSAWRKALKKGEPVHPFSDMKMAPVPVSCAVSVLDLLAGSRESGLFQVSGNRDISYADAAQLGAAALGYDERLVQPVLASETERPPAWLPLHTSMNIDRLKDSFGIEPPDVSWTVESCFAESPVLEPTGV